MGQVIPDTLPKVTVSETFANTVAKQGSKLAIRQTHAKANAPQKSDKFSDNFEQISYSWQEYNQNARSFAKALIANKIKSQNAVAIQGSNSAQWLFANVGTILAGGISAGVYPTNSTETSQHAAVNSGAKVIVVEDEQQLAKYKKMQSTAIKCFVVWNKVKDEKAKEQLCAPVVTWEEFLKTGEQVSDEKVEKRIKKQKPDQVCSLIYTSGTTGLPKGAALTHDNLMYTIRQAASKFHLDSSNHGLSYLPLSHIAAQQLDCFAPVTLGFSLDIAPKDALKGNNLKQHIVNARPTYFLAVPRVWEKFKEAIEEKLTQAPWYKRLLFNIGSTIGRKAVRCLQYIASKKPEELNCFDKLARCISHCALSIFNKLIFTPIKAALGLDRCQIAASGAGALSRSVSDFFAGLNIRIIDIYGLSETSGPATIGGDNVPAGSSGKPLAGTELKIAAPDEEGRTEIRLKGRHIFQGYWNNDKATQEAFDSDGFFRTGDVGHVDAAGNLFITGRMKELIKTSGGENIPPVRIEQNIAAELPIVSQSCVIGDKRNFLTCLITLKTEPDANGKPSNVLSKEVLAQLAALGSQAKTLEEAANDKLLRDHIEAGIKRANKKADSAAQAIQKFTILTEDFTEANNQMTATLKMRRAEIAKRNSAVIEQMYTA